MWRAFPWKTSAGVTILSHFLHKRPIQTSWWRWCRGNYADWKARLKAVEDKESMAKTAIYTAIVAGYDDLPQVRAVEPDIDYICFSDADIPAAKPWKVKRFKRVFADPQRDARRIKLLPHLFLPEHTHSLWLDATVQINNCPSEYIISMTTSSPLACAVHLERNCLYDEADAILGYEVDDPGIVRSQVAKYASLGVPKNVGLHVTTFMVRQHHHEDCRRFSYLWWNELAYQSKRDQLSFDFVRWLLQCAVQDMPYLMNSGEILSWGERSFWHKAGSEARKVTNSFWTYPSLNYKRDGIYHEQEIPKYFCVLAEKILKTIPHAAQEKQPVACSDSAPERLCLAKLMPTAKSILFIGNISPLWVLWAKLDAGTSTKIRWCAPIDDASRETVIKKYFPREITAFDINMKKILEGQLDRHIASSDLIVLDAKSVTEKAQAYHIAKMIRPTGKIMLFGENNEVRECIESISLSVFDYITFCSPCHVFQKK